MTNGRSPRVQGMTAGRSQNSSEPSAKSQYVLGHLFCVSFTELAGTGNSQSSTSFTCQDGRDGCVLT